MTVNDILTFLAQVLFIGLTTVAVIDYIRSPNPRRRDFALLSAALGIPLGIAFVRDVFGFQVGWLLLTGAFVLFSQPYFLFRLLQYYRPHPWWAHALILLGMVLCWIAIYTMLSSYPAATQMIVFGYSAVVDGYCTWGYSRGAANTRGTLQRRLFLITLSSGLFTLAVIGNIVRPLVPSVSENIGSAGNAIAALSAVLYYLAFIPPRWLRHAWQFEELRSYLTHSRSTEEKAVTVVEGLRQLCVTAVQAINGMTGAVVRWDDITEQWVVPATSGSRFGPETLQSGREVIERIWQQDKSAAVYVPKIPDEEERRRMMGAGARTWLLVPIHSSVRRWGVLIVLLRDRSLFIDDDLTLLELFAQQCAIVLENSRLIEELQRSNRELDQFAYVSSHDLKAPLRAISNLAGWLAEDAGDVLPPESKGHLAKLQGRARRMDTLLDDLLAYSRVGRQRHPVEELDTTKLVQNVTEIISPPPSFTVKLCGEFPVMRVERIPLETVFRNLIGNAVKHHHSEQGTIEISAQDKENYVEFIVKDDGPGIPPEFHGRIFEMFQTLQPRDRVEGSGLGLAIVKKSIESRGGTIQVESTPGEGSSFRFTWPKTTLHEMGDSTNGEVA